MKKQSFQFLIEIIKEAGEILIPFYEKRVETQIKGGNPQDIVTEADLKVNDFIIDKISSEFPDHNIYSEEGNNEQENKEGFPTWMIDPIDGTSNFSRQIPHFSISIGNTFTRFPLIS